MNSNFRLWWIKRHSGKSKDTLDNLDMCEEAWHAGYSQCRNDSEDYYQKLVRDLEDQLGTKAYFHTLLRREKE